LGLWGDFLRAVGQKNDCIQVDEAYQERIGWPPISGIYSDVSVYVGPDLWEKSFDANFG
jgi:hypothetical protein